MSDYNRKNWKNFSKSVIELDGYKCSYCGKTSDEAILQVHHKNYTTGLKPWEYPLSDCVTVCKGCHASIHGIIFPKFGWIFIDYEDLGDLIGTCEYCGSSLRHSFTIQHESWGIIEVGTMCCDNLTDTDIASNLKDSKTKFFSRRERFLNSSRWKTENNTYKIKQANFEVIITHIEDIFLIKINQMKSNKKYPTLIDAKTKVFEIIEDGSLADYVRKNLS